MKIRYCPSGDQMVLVEFPEEISPAVHCQVLSLARELWRHLRLVGLWSGFPLIDHWELSMTPTGSPIDDLVGRLKALERFSIPVVPVRSALVEVPVCYGGEMGPDLNFVAQHNQLSAEEAIQIHTSWTIESICSALAPDFRYLGGMSPRIAVPRLEEPRLRVPAGSVAIGGVQTGIYPAESPGGWRLIGRTPLRLFDLGRENPFLLSVGDRCVFTRSPWTNSKSCKLHRSNSLTPVLRSFSLGC